MLERKLFSDIPADFFMNQRFLYKDLRLIQETKRFQGVQLSENQLMEINRLVRMILNAQCGETFGQVNERWENSNLLCSSKLSIYGIFKQVNTDLILLDISNQFKSYYQKIRLYPELFKQKWDFKIFNEDLSINTLEMLKLANVAWQIASNGCAPKVVTSDDAHFVLCELLEPILGKLNLLDDDTFKKIEKNNLDWNIVPDLGPLIDANDMIPSVDEKKAAFALCEVCCANISTIIKNNLVHLRSFQQITKEQQQIAGMSMLKSN